MKEIEFFLVSFKIKISLTGESRIFEIGWTQRFTGHFLNLEESGFDFTAR